MAPKKKKVEPEPSEIPLPSNPEIKPGNIPEPEEEPETFPEKEPNEPKPIPELPETE